jgi:dethiobiotin synthetase/adenosylmethionine--8-amino-7-oxononanoate aminotransferase
MLIDGPGKGWAARAFYTDDGSTAMEVAIKMAFRKYITVRASGLGLVWLLLGWGGCKL